MQFTHEHREIQHTLKRFIDDQDAGGPEFAELRAKGAAHPIEATGRALRKLMAWVDSDRDQDYVEGSAAR